MVEKITEKCGNLSQLIRFKFDMLSWFLYETATLIMSKEHKRILCNGKHAVLMCGRSRFEPMLRSNKRLPKIGTGCFSAKDTEISIQRKYSPSSL